MKLVDTYYVEVTDPQGAVFGYSGPPVPTNSRYAFDVYSNGTVKPMVEFLHRYNSAMVTEILKSARHSAGSYAHYTWVKS